MGEPAPNGADTARLAEETVTIWIGEDRHLSLRAKTYDEARGIWQARVNDDWRFYFTIEEDLDTLIDIISHPE